MPTIFLILGEFFLTGLCAVGGGIATIPFWQDIAGRRPYWFTQTQVGDAVAVAQSAPGANGTNMAAYLGSFAGGPAGAAVGTAALMTPTILVDVLVGFFLRRYKDAKWLEAFMRILRPVSTGLILAGVASLFAIAFTQGTVDSTVSLFARIDFRKVPVFAVLLCSLLWKYTKNIHPLLLLAAGAGCGIIFKL
ncbi:MAG: chromate transporter [Oscillospiraceae bacterium]|nr:chromate transporter [Oscillospiraceae bacterium]